MNLTSDQQELLETVEVCTTRFEPGYAALEELGLVLTGQGRFGTWTRITLAGKQYLGTMPIGGGRAASPRGTGDTVHHSSSQVAAAGPANAGHSLRGASPRHRGIDAIQAQRPEPAIQPPAGVLNVEVLSMPGVTDLQERVLTAENDRQPSQPQAFTSGSLPQLMRDLTKRLINEVPNSQ